jgi:hypothetical protein
MTITHLDNGYLGKKFLRDKTSSKIIEAMSSVNLTTKVLKLQPIKKGNDDLKLVLSSFWLNLFNFFEHDKVVETPIAENQGFEVRHACSDDVNTKKVYGREYHSRKSSEREPLMDIRNQTKLRLALGSATRVRIIFKTDLITVLPIFALEHLARPEALDITLPKDNGLYYGVLSAAKILKEHLFTEFTITSDKEFIQSREYVLLSVQLRRLGYTLNVKDGIVSGRLGDKVIQQRHSIDVSKSKVTVSPLRFNKLAPLSTTGICTSGVDIAAAEDDGFSTLNVLDYRPIEKRDLDSKQDRSETGAICAAYNTKAVKSVFNECIYGIDIPLMRDLMRPTNFLSLSLQCSDYSSVKNEKDKVKAIDSLDTTIDMFVNALDIIEANNFATLLTENVANFSSSVEAKLYIRRLEEIGYTVKSDVLSAEHYNGYTKRSRSYIFASKLPTDFSWPEKEVRTVNVWNDIVIPNIDEFRDVSHTGGIETMLQGKALSESSKDVSAMTKAEKTKVRKFKSKNVIDANSHIAGSVIRSQAKQVAESLYAQVGDQYLFPNNKVLKAVMGIKESFDVSMFTGEAGSELIGQSVEVPMHHRISNSIKKHIMSYVKSIKSASSIVQADTSTHAYI